MWVNVLGKLPERNLYLVSGLQMRMPGLAQIRPVYKLPGGMIEQVHSVVPATQCRLSYERRMFPLIKWRLRYVAGVLLSVLTAISQVRAAPLSQSSDFDFSIYFTGNVRGNLEPCG